MAGEFPIKVKEFAASIPQPETRGAFLKSVTDPEKRMVAEWRKIYEAFVSKPMGTPWAEWRKQKMV